MRLFKGFDKDLKCRGFQFYVGEEYEEKKAELCNSGFHACENPLDCFSYYDPTGSRFCEVELDATEEKNSEDSKRVGKHIKIGAEIGIKGIIDAAIKFIFEKSDVLDGANAATTGDGANAATTGYSANAATTGDGANAATTGDGANAATTGYRANAATTGDGANAATTGYRANASVCSGVAVSIGIDGSAKGKIGCFIVLSEWEFSKDKNKYEIKNCKSTKVDGKIIKEDVFYKLNNGKFVECK